MSTILKTIEDIKQYFRNDPQACYFVSASNFNLMMMSYWIKNWFNVNFIDSYDQRNPSVILPEYEEQPVFNDIEGINQFLLGNKKIVEHIKQHNTEEKPARVMFLFYDEALEKMVESLDMTLIMPPNRLVKKIDNKITTTEIGNSVDVPSVPNALVKISDYAELQSIIKQYELGSEVVIQTAYGDSGKTTYFIADEDDYNRVSASIEAEERVKVMRKVQCQQVAIEACATRNGTYIGPILTEIIGNPELTPYAGGWCGNDVNPNAFSKEVQKTISRYTEQLGNALYKTGYQGYFEVDYLIDINDHDTVYLGEINPRVTGISALTNQSDFCSDYFPLFYFHLLEYSNVDLRLTPAEFNRLVMEHEHKPSGQLIFKYTQQELKVVTDIPQSGIYSRTEQGLEYKAYADAPGQLNADEIYILRILSIDDYVYKGADMVIVFAPCLMQDTAKNLTWDAQVIVQQVQEMITYRELAEEEQQTLERYAGQKPLKSADEPATRENE